MPAIAVEFPAGNITKAEGCIKCCELLTLKALFTVVDATVLTVREDVEMGQAGMSR
jgi:hypothetical protein